MKFIEIDGVEYEVFSFCRNLLKVLLNPVKNWLAHRWILQKIMLWSGSPLAKESMERPGGWRAELSRRSASERLATAPGIPGRA